MPRKKTTSGAASATAPQGRRTRRQTMQMASMESEEPPSPEEVSSESSGTPIPTEITALESLAIVAASAMALEDIKVEDKGAEQMMIDSVEQVLETDVQPSVAVNSELMIEDPVIHHHAENKVESASITATVEPPSETDPRIVDEIETAIEKISIQSEPLAREESESPAMDSSTMICERSFNDSSRVGTPSVIETEDSKEDTSRAVDEDDALSSRRRSSRIKTISKTKQKSRGHGLVRDKERAKVGVDHESSTTNSSVHPSDATPPPPPAPAEEMKPQKIKSRWLDSAKRESLDLGNSLPLGTATDSSAMTPNAAETPQDVAKSESKGNNPPPPPPPIDYFAPDPEVHECLKQLNQIKDNIYNCERNISKEAKKMTCDCFLTAEEKAAGELGCGEDCLNRLLMIECGSRCVVGDRCTNRRFQTHQYAPVVVFKTEMKGFGLRAAADLQEGEFIMEYVGEVLNAKQFDKRANAYSKIKNKHYYFMALRSDAVIDATAKGNISRFINHSCDPNAETQKWTVNGELRIGFFTTRFIRAGEEVTFDYQYQRYGKEAQKCYCEAANCRGWIGEEPESDEEDDEEGDEDEEEETDAEDDETEVEEEGGEKTDRGAKKGEKKKRAALATTKKKPKATPRKPKAKAERKTATATSSSSTTTRAVVERKARKTARSRRQEILDDLDLDAEIDSLAKTGLKNQAHTLKLSRMMVRAKLPKTRLRLLALIQGGEGPCRRLFLDYHGLRLLHGWMTDAHEQKDVELKMEIVRTLQILPIPNKTMLKDSHVLTAVANYGGLKLDSEKKEIVSEEGPLVAKFKKRKNKEKKKKAEEDVEVKQEVTVGAEEEQAVEKMDVSGGDVVKMEVDAEKAEEEEQQLTEEEQAEVQRVQLANEMRALCKEMILQWVQLPEVFRIPKKERIEQMKEHEREADLRSLTLGLPNEEQEKQPENRFKPKGEDIKWVKREFNVKVTNDGMSKNQRRRLFAMQVEEQKRNQQRMDAWQHHEFRCNFFGLDPYRVRPEDVPAWVDLENRQWFTYDLTEVPTPPNYVHVTMKAPEPEQANIEDYELPKMDLPEGWEYAMDGKGRLYYYHKKIRIPQWELPIRLLPLSSSEKEDGGGDARVGGEAHSLQNGHHGGGRSAAEEERNDDSSTTDTCDSSEEEMVKRINRIKKLRKIGVPNTTIVKLNLHERNSDDEVTREEVTKAEGGKMLLGQSKRLPNRESLVEYREISPRREEDRLYGQAEMKRYKETKEKFKQRKEMLKRRKLEKMMKAGLISNDPEKRVSFRSIQITDDELYDETDDEQEAAAAATEESVLNGDFLPVDVPATTTAPLMEKIVLGNSRVDELDEPHKYNEMTRLKIRERNAKRSRALKVQMKLKKMKMDEEFGEGNSVNGHQSQQQQQQQLADGGLEMSPLVVNGEKAVTTPVFGGGGVGIAGLGIGGSSSLVSADKAKRIKDKFRANIAGVIVQHLSPYRRDSCPVGRITNNEDFKHLAKKLTHFVLVKELKHCATVADLSVNDSVKLKSKEFIRKYMSKYGKVYERPVNEPEY